MISSLYFFFSFSIYLSRETLRNPQRSGPTKESNSSMASCDLHIPSASSTAEEWIVKASQPLAAPLSPLSLLLFAAIKVSSSWLNLPLFLCLRLEDKEWLCCFPAPPTPPANKAFIARRIIREKVGIKELFIFLLCVSFLSFCPQQVSPKDTHTD